MLDPVGFWSYARLDDEFSRGYLSQLRAIVGDLIGIKHGGKIVLWQDVASIAYGANWAAEIERAIGQTTFYIPIVTPRFLKSEYCRDEFRAYRRRMTMLGRDDLIFPVHYVDVDHLSVEETVFGDDLASLRRSQWIDFRPHFLDDPKSPDVRRLAFGFAGGVMQALRRLARPPVLETGGKIKDVITAPIKGNVLAASTRQPVLALEVKDVTTASFKADVLAASTRQPVLIDFWAPWCGPCKQLAPVLEKAVADSEGKVTLVKMNIDDHPQIPGQLGIQSIPAVIAFDKGQPVDGFMGALSESQVRGFIERLLGPLGEGIDENAAASP